jgi:energy-coupling factor transport system ATP-binding protein
LAPILEVRNLSHIYSIGTPFQHIALDDVSFSVEQGEFVGIIGHTGSGKSTLIQHLNGLLKPTSGTVMLDGKDIWENKATTRQTRFRVGLVFQYPEYQLFEETVYKDIAFGPKNMGLDLEEIDRRVRQAAGFVGLTEEQLNASPFDLS